MKMKKIKYLLFAAILTCSQSCDSWLDIRPEDSVGEDELLSSYEGVEKIKNGIYLKLSSENLYALNLSGGMLDVMGQLYNISESASGADQSAYLYHVNYTYDNDVVKGATNAIWTGLYDIIANVNNLLEKSALYKDFYTPAEYNIIRGELYGVRAFLHFDLLRLFGPMPKVENGDLKSIPYYTERSVSAAPISTFNEVIRFIEEDLALAEALLYDDNVLQGVRIRQYRMNYLAVRGIQARVALYKGDRINAARLARQVVGQGGGLRNILDQTMPWVAYNDATSSTTPDRFFSSEVIFGIENSQRQTAYLNNFEYNVSLSRYLIPSSTFLGSLYIDKAKDYRNNIWRDNPGNGRYAEFAKYQVISELDRDGSKRYIQPLLRRSELLLILAEATDDQKEAMECIDELYIHRGYESGSVAGKVTSVGLTQFILEEYRRECYGEGQYFYQLKRRGVTQLTKQDGNSQIEMGAKQYEIPLPDSEIKYRK